MWQLPEQNWNASNKVCKWKQTFVVLFYWNKKNECCWKKGTVKSIPVLHWKAAILCSHAWCIFQYRICFHIFYQGKKNIFEKDQSPRYDFYQGCLLKLEKKTFVDFYFSEVKDEKQCWVYFRIPNTRGYRSQYWQTFETGNNEVPGPLLVFLEDFLKNIFILFSRWKHLKIIDDLDTSRLSYCFITVTIRLVCYPFHS